MIELVIGDRQSGKTQRLVEKAIELLIKNKKIAVVYPNQNLSLQFIRLCVEFILRKKSPFINYSEILRFDKESVWIEGGKGIISLYHKIINQNETIFVIFDDYKIDDFNYCHKNQNYLISGNQNLVQKFNELKLDFKVEYLQKTEKKYTREEVLKIMNYWFPVPIIGVSNESKLDWFELYGK